MTGNIKYAVRQLALKYGVTANAELNLLPGCSFLNENPGDNDIPLLTWRFNRKFIELKKIISDKVVKNVSILRFCILGDPNVQSLNALMYREFNLCEFITLHRPFQKSINHEIFTH